jgi:hypothetical protein
MDTGWDTQTNGTEDTEISPWCYRHLIPTKVPKTSIGKKTISLTNDAGETGYEQL